MGLFVTSTSNVDRHGIFAFDVPPPSTIQAVGSDKALILGQFPWGPTGEVFAPSSPAELYDKLAPKGMSRTGSGYLSIIKRQWNAIKAIRVVGTAAAKATAVINKTGPTALVTITLKYKGVAGNSVVITTGAATDGDANHFNITASVTSGGYTTTDIIHNYNVSGTGSDTVLTQTDLDKLKLIGAVAKNSAGVPILGNTTCSTGAEGTINSAAYLGTAGTADLGLALAESDLDIQHVCADDPGNSVRAAVNAGLQAHAALMTDRVVYINGDSGATAAAAQAAVASYRSTRVVYVDPWFYITDDTDGTERLVPPGPMAASVATMLSPSTSIAWKGALTKQLMAGIVRLEADRGTQIGPNSTAGIVTIIKRRTGGYAFECDNVTNAPSNPATRSLRRTRMGDYIARSVCQSLEESVDSPNVPVNRQDVVNAIDVFLSALKRNQGRNPNATPHILNYSMAEVESANTDSSLSGGDFAVPADIKLSSAMERIFFNMNFGETVTITAT